MKPNAYLSSVAARQHGSVLLEALIAILIFSFGILGLIGIQASAVGLSIDAKYRADAAYLTNQIVAQMWLDRANLLAYAHHATGTACDPALNTGAGATGAASANAKVHDGTTPGSWTHQIAGSLPGADEDKQQIKVTPTTAGAVPRLVEITLCWKRPSEATWHRHVTATRIYQ
jgi:type IV pilus assembly protein PilV